ncbi:S1 family peptidase [Nocardiopsis sp. RSe5-2]|uniref:S1 family peptidase n=1 Tax=Nocardiopsis endophytica TaxID=3018445 RepID=A0ABT4U0V9_9ACTN|nr:S1 family peptidase [Nocardiopsis endophytica]MDA2809997.1 S1 family peptidase [Nocardiopsis endophytica]
MRKSTIARAAGGGALALGLVGAGFAALSGGSPQEAASVAAESASGGSVAGDQLEAMQRDLGLSEAEAKELLDTEAEARDTDQALRSDLGEAFGGSWFDIESGTLTVAVTDASAADQVTAAGAEAEVVDNGQDELDAMIADLNAEGAELSEGIAGWYPDIRQDSVVITALEGEEAAAEEFAEAAGVPADAYTVETTKDEPRLYADVVGGDAYSTGGGRCSIGFATETGFVTAGHCGDAGTQVSSEDGSGTGTVTDAEFPGADMAAVETDDNWTPTPAVNDYEGGTVTVAGSEEAPEGASICRSGSTTGWHCGTVQAKNQSVSYPQGTVNGLTQTDVCAEPGDSGGSWLSDDQAQGVTSGGSGDCTSGGTTFFQPVNPILETYGVTLLTG